MTVDPELLDELRRQLRTIPQLKELSASESQETVDAVRRRFVGQSDRVWWWESLDAESASLAYGERDGLAYLGRLVPGDAVVRLVVTDDETGPWPVFEGEAQAFWGLLRELRFFEYFVVARGYEWVVFDTHHNTLVVSGELLGRARSLGAS